MFFYRALAAAFALVAAAAVTQAAAAPETPVDLSDDSAVPSKCIVSGVL